MARARTGSLVYRTKSGWNALVTQDIDGETVREWVPLGTHNRQAAKRKLAREVAKAERGEATTAEAAASEETVAEYKAAWIQERRQAKIVSAKEENSNLDRHVLPEIGHKPLSSVRPPDVLGVIKGAIAKGLSRQTVHHIRGAMCRLFEAAVLEELIPANPVDRIKMKKVAMPKETKKERCILSDDEVATYMASPTDLEVRLLGLAARFEGGMRTSDLHRWDWSMLDRVHFVRCTIHRSKTNDFQELDMPPVVGEALRLRWEAAGRPEAGPVFPCRRGPRAGQPKALRGNSYAKRLRRALLRAGIIRHQCTRPDDAKRRKRDEACCPNMTHDPLYSETAKTLPVDFHSFRRAFASAGAAAGVNAQTMMRLAHHSDEKTHKRYVMNTPAMRQIPAAVVPKLPLGLFHQKQQAATIEPARSELSAARPAGFEPATGGLEGELSAGTPAYRRVSDGATVVDDEVPASTTAQLLFVATNADPAPRGWLVSVAELGPGLVKAALELPTGALDGLSARGAS